jgi:PAS domain S-box-containing protein
LSVSPSKLRRLAARPWRSLSFRLSFPVGVVIFAAVALGAYLNYQSQRAQLTARVKAEGAGFAETLRRATFRTMLADQRGHLYSIIRDVAGQPGISRVRIFNAQGRIVFSSRPGETGTQVDKQAEACYACHAEDRPLARLPLAERSRIFRADGQRMLGTVLPIYNRPSCSGPPCHAHPPEQKVLGVLDVDMSLAGLDRQLAAELERTLVFALLLFLGASTMVGLSVIFTVTRAVAQMSGEVDKLAAGDHYHVTPVRAPAELGRLSRSIADMAQRVARRTERMNRRYRHLVTDSPDAIFMLDGRGGIRLANPEAGRILRAEPGDLVGRGLAELVVKEDRPALLKALEEASQGVSRLFSLSVEGAGGQPRMLEGRLRHLETESGEPAFMGTFMDITDRSQLEAQLVKHASLAAVGQTVSGLVPYIRNLLQGVNNATYIVEQGLESGDLELVGQGWQMVAQSVARVSSVAEDLLYYADYRIESLRPFDPHHLLMDVGSLAGERAARAGAEVVVDSESACGRLAADQRGLKKALANLVNNALDALAGRPEPGRVVLACERTAAGQVAITVDDNGPGIPEEVGRHLFTGLFTTKGARGTGMGLLLVQKIAEEHGGYVSYSCPLAGGTRFTLVLPEGGPGRAA